MLSRLSQRKFVQSAAAIRRRSSRDIEDARLQVAKIVQEVQDAYRKPMSDRQFALIALAVLLLIVLRDRHRPNELCIVAFRRNGDLLWAQRVRFLSTPRRAHGTVVSDELPLTVRQAATYLGVSPQTVYLWVERKQIPHLRVMGRNIRFLKSDLEPFRATFKQEVGFGKTE